MRRKSAARTFEELLKQSDYVVPLAVATAETENLIGEKQLANDEKNRVLWSMPRAATWWTRRRSCARVDAGASAGCAARCGPWTRRPDAARRRIAARAGRHRRRPHTAGLTLPAIEHQSMETVAQAAEILKGRAPKRARSTRNTGPERHCLRT
jgi:D-3-phosphoglycerate dehydrogenase